MNPPTKRTKSTKQVTSKRMKSTKQVTSIEDLPPEMISELFEYLPPKDLVVCSLVNRRWHSIYASFKLHRLVAMDYNRYYCYLLNLIFKWYDTNERIKEIERCGPAIFFRLKKRPLLSNLKQLALSGQRFESELKELNRFQQLMQLEIKISFRCTKLHLKLPRLRVLAFHCFNYACALSIDCPELSTLVYSEEEDANLLKVKHPETIRKLETNLVGPKLTQFKNVECLGTSVFHTISKDTLLSLPKLRELRYNRNFEHFFWHVFELRVGGVDRMKRTLNEFLDEAKRLRGSDFRFTFAGFQLTNLNVEQIDFGMRVDQFGRERVSNEYVYMKNYHLIEPDALHFIDHVNYTRLLSHSIGEFPRCFSQKFTGVHVVQTSDVIKDPDHFLWFLKSLGSVERLELEAAGLSQEFYDQLPSAARLLIKLELRGDKRNRLQLNFDFVRKFSFLSHLEVQPVLSLESSTSLEKSLGGEGTIVVDVKSERPHVPTK